MIEELKKIQFLKNYDSLFFVINPIEHFNIRLNLIKNKIKNNFDDIDLIDSLYNDDYFNSEVENISYIYNEICTNSDFYNKLNTDLKELNIHKNISINLRFNFNSKQIYGYQQIKHDYLVFEYMNGFYILNINASFEKINFKKQLLNF